MSSLQQLQVTYVPDEDRILLRANTKDRDEFRFWLTRRLVIQLVPGLMKVLTEEPEIGVQPDPAARREIFKFRQQQALAEADFETGYREEAEAYPLGEQPLLVTSIQLRRKEKGEWMLVLLPARGQGSEIVLREGMVHSLATLLRKAADGARWGDFSAMDQTAAERPADATIN